MQQKLETGEQGCSEQRVMAALTSLSSLALQTSTLRFAPPEAAGRLAALFLDQLVTLCEAQQGALFLQHPLSTTGAANTREDVLIPPTLTLIARTGMSAEEAQTKLTNAVPIPVDPLEWSVDLPSSISWTRSLDAAFSCVVRSGEAAFPIDSQCSAVLLFAWSATGQIPQHDTQHQTIQLLPFLADLADTILVHVLTALHEDKQPMEVFPSALPQNFLGDASTMKRGGECCESCSFIAPLVGDCTSEVLATVGHEFRGPLTTIQGYAATLQHYDQQLALDERQDFLRAISEASMHLGKLVDRFLELAQFENHVHSFVPATVNLLTLAQESITAAQKSRHLHLLLTPSLARKHSSEADTNGETSRDELTISGDRRLLRSMLDTLLENASAYSTPESLIEVAIEPIAAASALAARHTSSGPGIHLALILSAHFQEQESLIAIRIRDHGIGILPEHLPLIFRRFYRVDTSLTRDVNGLGLGLALCKAIVALHRGMLWVESKLGEGSTFTLIFPRGISPEFNESVEIHIQDKKRLEQYL